MGWADNPLKEHLVAFAKALDLGPEKVWILRVPELASSTEHGFLLRAPSVQPPQSLPVRKP